MVGRRTHFQLLADFLHALAWVLIDAALATLETKLGAKLLDLTTEQRISLNKMGDKSEAFCRESLIVGRQNVAELTPRASPGSPRSRKKRTTLKWPLAAMSWNTRSSNTAS